MTPPTVSSAICPKSLMGRGNGAGVSQGALTPTTPLSPPWGEGRPYHCGAPLGNFGPWGAELQTAMGGRAHSTPQPFYPAPSLHYRVLLVSQVPHSQPYLGTVLPPSPLPGPYRVKAHPVPGGGSTVGGGAVPLSAAAAFPLPSSPGHVCWKGPERGGGHCGVGASPLRQPSLLWGGAGSGVLGGGALG